MGINSQSSVPKFTAGEVLTAANMNISAGTGVPVFDTTTQRDAAFGGTGEKVLAEGQLCYVENLTGVAQIQYYDGAAWVSLVASGLVQVKSTTKTDTFTTTSTTFTDVTGLSVSITPTSASNKVLVLGMITGQGSSGVNAIHFRLMRDSTAIGIGDAAGTRTRATGQLSSPSVATALGGPFTFLDTPATTSATTYKLQIRVNAAGTGYINRTEQDTDSDSRERSISTITVMEVIP